MDFKLFLVLILSALGVGEGSINLSWIGEIVNNAQDHICYGSLIHPNWMISAASCFFDPEDHRSFYNISTLQAQFQDQSSTNEIIQIVSSSYELVDHIYYNDLALVQLDKSIQLKPVQLPQWYMDYANEIAQTFIEKPASGNEVNGWERITVKVLENLRCGLDEVRGDMRKLCIGQELIWVESRRGLPLFVADVMDTPIIVGVSGTESPNATQSNVFTRITEYLGWIGAIAQ